MKCHCCHHLTFPFGALLLESCCGWWPCQGFRTENPQKLFRHIVPGTGAAILAMSSSSGNFLWWLLTFFAILSLEYLGKPGSKPCTKYRYRAKVREFRGGQWPTAGYYACQSPILWGPNFRPRSWHRCGLWGCRWNGNWAWPLRHRGMILSYRRHYPAEYV